MRILLIRHGQSEANVSGHIQGPGDPLTPHGREQAHALGRHLSATWTIDALIASSLDRARETAAIIAGYTGNQISYDPRYREIDSGHAIGLLWSDWREANPDLARNWGWDVRHADAAWDGGESGRDMCARAFAAFDELIAREIDSARTTAIVTHGGVIAWLAARLSGDSLETWPARHSDVTNCSITEIDLNSAMMPQITNWNVSTHLDHLTPREHVPNGIRP